MSPSEQSGDDPQESAITSEDFDRLSDRLRGQILHKIRQELGLVPGSGPSAVYSKTDGGHSKYDKI